jgi:hypothetical protein
MMEEEFFYRLRKQDKIICQMRRRGDQVFFSKDGFWWRGDEQLSAQVKKGLFLVDDYTGIRDKNNRFLFAEDIVQFRLGSIIKRKRAFQIVKSDQQFQVRPLFPGPQLTIEEIAQKPDLEWVSYTFLNADFGVGN